MGRGETTGTSPSWNGLSSALGALIPGIPGYHYDGMRVLFLSAAALLAALPGCGSPKKVQPCRPCGGDGTVACAACAGSGRTACFVCSGTKLKCCDPCEKRPASKDPCVCCKAIALKKDCAKCRGVGILDCRSCEKGKTSQGKTCSACKGGAAFLCELCYTNLPAPCLCCCGAPRRPEVAVTHQAGPCGICGGAGTIACPTCKGSAVARCTNCGGDGKTDVHKGSSLFRDRDHDHH